LNNLFTRFAVEKLEYVVREGDTMFSICSYIAETEEAINLVEGEKIYIIGKISISHKMLPLHSL